MPAVSATGERRLTIEQPVTLKPRGGYPGPLSCQASDLIAVAESKALHVSERVDKGTYLPRCAVVQRPGAFRIIAATGFDLRQVQSTLQNSFTKQNGEQR